MSHRLLGTLLALALALGAALPVGALELDEARERLSDARGDLGDVERTVEATREEVEAADQRLRTAATELETVRGQLDDAQRALAEADARERRSAAALDGADERLDEARTTWTSNRDRLQERAVATYKHGRAVPGEVLVRGVGGAGDWHEVAVTLEAVDRLVTADRRLVDETAAATRQEADARAEVTAVRSEALSARRAADRERRRVEQLVERQERIVERIDDEADRRRAALERLESDAAARAELVRDLERRVDRLELARLAPVVAPADLDLGDLGPAPDWASRLPAAGRRWAPAIEAAAAAQGLDGRLLAAVVWTESAFRPDAVSHAGAIGLAQLMPATARGLGVDPRDPLDNVAGGAAYLRAQLGSFGRADLALAAYNAGPGRVVGAGGRVPDIVETQLYVVRVLERFEHLGGG